MISQRQYLYAINIIKQYRKQCVEQIKEIDDNSGKVFELRIMLIRDTDLSSRAKNILLNKS